ncbi:MAG: radical SAM protein [Bacteroidales bacterium]|jgi:pyruvate formate lyase activating enzyme|nr:radical SAM protein [Bacteroidales bacterium]
MQNLTAPFIGIKRNCLATDGFGVTTLAAFWGCPLACKYCLNPQSLDKSAHVQQYTPEELYEQVKIDELYFLATGGGVTFGGGEPCLYADFIAKFRTLCGEMWNITVETSLNIPQKNLETLLPVINHYIVDSKDLNNEIYTRYTGKDNTRVIANLKWLIAQGKAGKIRVRVPKIAHYNSEADIQNTVLTLQEMGLNDIEIFSYKTGKTKT